MMHWSLSDKLMRKVSIRHNAFAEKVATMGELKREINNGGESSNATDS